MDGSVSKDDSHAQSKAHSKMNWCKYYEYYNIIGNYCKELA